jgi:hypothetical protein
MMVQTTTKYICDICGCEIKKRELPFDCISFLLGDRIIIADGIIGRRIKFDVCNSCFENMKEFCKSKKEGAKTQEKRNSAETLESNGRENLPV